MVTFLASLLLFTLLHVVVTRATHRPFHVNLALSRGVAAVFLTAVGFFSLFHWLPLWDRSFLAFHDNRGAALFVLAFLCGHFVADLVWLAVGAWRFASTPRLDLIVHHLVGLVACACAYQLEMGHAMIGVALTSEMMPVSSGLASWGKAVASPRLELAALRLRVLLLLVWRLPLWSFVLVVVSWNVANGALHGPLAPVYPIALFMALSVTVLDVYWSVLSVRGLKKLEARIATAT